MIAASLEPRPGRDTDYAKRQPRYSYFKFHQLLICCVLLFLCLFLFLFVRLVSLSYNVLNMYHLGSTQRISTIYLSSNATQFSVYISCIMSCPSTRMGKKQSKGLVDLNLDPEAWAQLLDSKPLDILSAYVLVLVHSNQSWGTARLIRCKIFD